jgi:cytidylate kinase
LNVEIGRTARQSVHIGGADDERHAANWRENDERQQDDDERAESPRDNAAGTHACMLLFMRMRQLIVAIDGPSGAGKGTVARAVADALGYRHVDSGAMYRAVGWKARRDGVPLTDEDAVASLAQRSRISLSREAVTIDEVDVTREIRSPHIDEAAAAVARLPKVRAVLVERQRQIAEQGGIVMEGRDIGTVVFPRADVKIYLDASPEERARRRAADPAHSGGSRNVSDVATQLTARDALDRTRPTSPLYAAADAIVLDTTDRPIDLVVSDVLSLVRKHIGELEPRGR